MVGKHSESLAVFETIMEKKEKFSILCHDLRSSITPIKEAISLVMDETVGKINKEQERCLSIANEGIKRLVKMIDELDSGENYVNPPIHAIKKGILGEKIVFPYRLSKHPGRRKRNSEALGKNDQGFSLKRKYRPKADFP